MRIAKAVREGKGANTIKALQWILSHSFSAKLLAVRRVTENKGAKTPGSRWKNLEYSCTEEERGINTNPERV